MLVIDACGVGALPDAAAYGDEGTNTLCHVAAAVGGLSLPTLEGLGLGSIVEVAGVAPAADPALYGRLRPHGPGKDSIAGHWELMGVVLDRPLPTYPGGFPTVVVERLEDATGQRMLCNRPDNGLAAIAEFGAEQLRDGGLILYTSQDSVLQLAAHVDRVPETQLYEACRAARAVMSGGHGVGRVIARPFAGADGEFERTHGRRDFALLPPSRSYLQELQDAGVEVHAVGKISDLFAGVGVSRSYPGADNATALASTEEILARLDQGLVFVNLIETDQVFGHRKDTRGFAGALEAIDSHLAGVLAGMREGDLLIVTADHGVDPDHPGTDHTREYAPVLAVTGSMLGRRAEGGVLGGYRRDGALADVGATVLSWLTGRGAPALTGRPLLS